MNLVGNDAWNKYIDESMQLKYNCKKMSKDGSMEHAIFLYK